MKNINHLITVTILSFAAFPLVLQTNVALQNGPPTDRPGQGNVNRADPCAHVPDPPGNANGIDKQCDFGGSAGVSRGDFNNDGIADLAVGVPGELRILRIFDPDTFSFISTNQPEAGTVNVIYGSSSGLTPTGTQVIDQGFLNVGDGSHFGAALASGKFRGSAFASDLAVGAPGAKKNNVRVGAIYVFFSASGKLPSGPNQVFFADQFSGAGTPLGANPLKFPEDMTMVWGDFNGDGVGDLAAEIQNGGVSHSNSRSAVIVLYGTAGVGFSASNSTLLVVDDGLSPNNFNPPTGCARLHFCGVSRGHVGLTAGDINGDSRDELLIGAPNCKEIEDDGSVTGSGAGEGCVAILPGRNGMPLDRFFGWKLLLAASDVDRGGGFGVAMAVGNFNNSGNKDVAVGAPESFRTVPSSAGLVRVFSDVNAGGTTAGGQQSAATTSVVLTQQTPGVNQTSESGDRFGAALAANDFNGDGFTDLAVGAPGESSGNNVNHGLVTVFSGSITGLPGGIAPLNLSLGSTGLLLPVNGAQFGSSLAAWNFGLTAQADLAIGSPFSTIRSVVPGVPSPDIQGAGSVLTMYGLPNVGLTPNNMQLWTEDPGFVVCVPSFVACLRTNGVAKAGNHFGASLY